MGIVRRQTILMKYHALFVIFICRLLQSVRGALWVGSYNILLERASSLPELQITYNVLLVIAEWSCN